jgi:hypothetical protein
LAVFFCVMCAFLRLKFRGPIPLEFQLKLLAA